MKKELVYYGGEISGKRVAELLRQLRAITEKGSEPILLIASEGGSTDAGYVAYNGILALGRPITTVNLGLVRSASLFMFMAGTTRITCPQCTFHMHSPRFNLDYKVEATVQWLTDKLNHLLRDVEVAASIISDRTGMPAEKAKQLISTETYMSPEEAIEAKIAHKIQQFAASGHVLTIL